MRNARLLTLLFIVMLVLITAGSFVYINALARQAVDHSVRGNLESSAIVVASGIDGDSFAAIRPGDESTASFLAIRDTLHRIEKADPTFRYIYTMRQNGNTVEFVVDGDYGFEPDAARIGEPYYNVTRAMIAGFSSPSSELEIVTDQWGETISGYAPIRDHAGRVVGLVGVDEDSTTVAGEIDHIRTVNYAILIIIVVLFALGAVIFDIRRTRVEVMTQLANRKLNQLNSIIRHDIFNTLTGLSGYVEMAQETDNPADAKMMLETVRSLTDKIEQQIAFTRDYQDLGLNMPGWHTVQETVTKAVSQLDLSSVIVDLDFAGLEMYADPLLDRVFFHLFENSIEHGQGVTRIHGYFRHSGIGVIIVIEDNGAGIPTADKEAIFIRKSFRDTGLGLFLVREILALTGITISETGTPGKGARFEIRVPNRMARVTSREFDE